MTFRESVRHVLDLGTLPGSTNRITPAKVRKWAREYLEMYSDDMAAYPELQAQPHWNLWSADWDASHPALAVIILFEVERVTLAVVLGPAADVRAYGEDEFPEDPLEVIPRAAARA